MHPGTPRDIDIQGWLDGLSFKPANSEAKQAAHEVARQLVALFGAHMHDLLPAGRDKSLLFTLLEDVLMRANRALAIGGGPKDGVTAEALRSLLIDLQANAIQLGALLPSDPRIAEYKAAQLDGTYKSPFQLVGHDGPHLTLHTGQPAVPGVTLPMAPPDMTGWPEDDADAYLSAVNAEVGRVHPGLGWTPTTTQQAELAIPEKPFTQMRYIKGEAPDAHYTFLVKFQEHWADPQVSVELSKHDEGENISDHTGMDIDDPDVLEEFASSFLAAANRLRAAKAALR